MGEQRQFRFRLPWLAPQRSPAQPQRPRFSSENPRPQSNQPTTSIPIQRPNQPPPKTSSSLPTTKPTTVIPPSISSPSSLPTTKALPSSSESKSTSPPKPTTQTTSSTATKPPPPPKSIIPSTSPPSSQATDELIKPLRSSTTRTPPKSPKLSTPSPSSLTLKSSKTSSESTSSKSVASSKSPSPSRSASDSLKTTSPTQPTSQSRVELGKSQSPIDVSFHATSKAQEGQEESAKKVSTASPKTTLKKLEVKPQSQGSSEPSISTQPRSSVAQDKENEIEPRAPLQKNEPKVEITNESSEKSTPKDDSIGGEGIKGPGLAKGLISEEMAAIPTPPPKGMTNKPTRSFNNNNEEHQFSEVKETSYIGKQIKSVGPSQAIEGNTSIPLHEPPKESASRPTVIKEGISKIVSKLTEGPELGEKQIVVVTLTGENKGASMLISSEQAKKEKPIHIHRGYKSDPDESPESSTDEETGTKRKGFNDKPSSPTTAYVNNNVQSVNNSIVVEASVTERNPGVHLLMSQDTSEAVKENGKSKHIEARKAEFTSTRSERLTHEPTVRRRCLRGLFLESSDSEPENPNKPRRHGCRYSCGGENEEF